jgi:putative PIN family toxin of toxin-antitoxin system
MRDKLGELRAVIDTNVWVSAMLNPAGRPADVLHALREGRFTLVTSEPLLAELADVLRRPRIVRRFGIAADDIAELILLLRARAELVAITGSVRVCRDPDDDVVIETAIRGRASVIVTRDDDLKGAAEIAFFLGTSGVSVLSVQHFLDALSVR